MQALHMTLPCLFTLCLPREACEAAAGPTHLAPRPRNLFLTERLRGNFSKKICKRGIIFCTMLTLVNSL